MSTGRETVRTSEGARPDLEPLGNRTAVRGRRLGEILQALGVLVADEALLGRYEQEFGDGRRLGEILIAQGVATREQVELALEIQERNSRISAGADIWAGAQPATATATKVSRLSPRTLRNVQSCLLFCAAAVAVVIVARSSGSGARWYGVGALALLSVKLIGSAVYRPVLGPALVGHRVAVIASFYNEDPRAFVHCLDSILAQTRPPEEIWVVDDGSKDEFCYRLALDTLRDHPDAVVRRLDVNGGKRHAQGIAFEGTTCDIVVTVDSDTVLDRDAIAEGLRPFSDPRVTGVAANVRALNHRRNLLTRLIDLRYANAFLFDRAAYSTVGSVVCCCGSLSFFRTDVVRQHLADFLHQTFLGVHVQYGDDRRLTQYALMHGTVRLQDTSLAYTLVPETLGHYRRQQLRWNKSFFRESLWAIRRFGPRRWPFWISLVELAIWLTFTASLLIALYVRPLLTGVTVPWSFVAFGVILAYARNVRYFGRPGVTATSQLVTFACAPLYTVLHVVLLTPLRLWSLLTLRKTGWGTRSRVEVRGRGPAD